MNCQKLALNKTLTREDIDLLNQLLLWVFAHADKIVSDDSPDISVKMLNFKNILQTKVDLSSYDTTKDTLLIDSKTVYKVLVPSAYSRPMLDDLFAEATIMCKDTWFVLSIDDKICFNLKVLKFNCYSSI